MSAPSNENWNHAVAELPLIERVEPAPRPKRSTPKPPPALTGLLAAVEQSNHAITKHSRTTARCLGFLAIVQTVTLVIGLVFGIYIVSILGSW